MPSMQSRVLLGIARASGIGKRQFDPERVARRPAPPPRRLPGVAVEPHDRAGWPGFDLIPQDDSGRSPVVFLHGGGRVQEISALHWRYAARLAVDSGRRVIVPIYPLAPAHTRTELDAALPVLYHDVVSAEGRAPVVVADSAGAGLALRMVQSREEGDPPPALVALVSGGGDATYAGPDVERIQPSDPLLWAPHVRGLTALWSEGLPADDPRISPGLGPLDGLTSVALYGGTRDIALPGVRRLERRLRDVGVDVHSVIVDGMPHDYPIMPIPEAREQLADLVALLTGVD